MSKEEILVLDSSSVSHYIVTKNPSDLLNDWNINISINNPSNLQDHTSMTATPLKCLYFITYSVLFSSEMLPCTSLVPKLSQTSHDTD